MLVAIGVSVDVFYLAETFPFGYQFAFFFLNKEWIIVKCFFCLYQDDHMVSLCNVLLW
jgi:hypothetical protein